MAKPAGMARKSGLPYSQVISAKRLRRIARLERPTKSDAVDRPRLRSDCRGGPRPCPFVGCKHNLYLDVDPSTGSIKLNRPDLEPWEMAPGQSCEADISELGDGVTLEVVGQALNITREVVRLIEVKALRKLRLTAPKEEV